MREAEKWEITGGTPLDDKGGWEKQDVGNDIP